MTQTDRQHGHQPLRVAHVMAMSLPLLSGYTIRGKYIVDGQARAGLQPCVVTGPFYPGNPAVIDDQIINGVPYYRVPHFLEDQHDHDWRTAVLRWGSRLVRRATPAPIDGDTPPATMGRPQSRSKLRATCSSVYHAMQEARFRRRLERLFRCIRPDLVHAHTPYHCGAAALAACQSLGIPFVYEVRGCWEESAVAERQMVRGGLEHQRWRQRETMVMQRADAVVCICEQLRQEVIARGVPPQRVFVIPNGFDPATIQRSAPAVPVNLPRLSGTVVGYIGSLRQLEGVDGLIRAAAILRQRQVDVSVLIVGEGTHRAGLQSLADKLGIADRCYFPGRVPHAEIAAYYRAIDVFVVSRPALPVTELVTPLKPFEAMAFGRALVVSDLPALREIVRPEDTGLLYRADDDSHLADQCLRLIQAPDLRARLGDNARRWVEQERTWDQLLAGLAQPYALALQARAAA
ncbi:MAG: glycosyltransferase [Planctomycetia bacterium]|nr:glycosyltransferase [Planctomycetia bacterium]